MAQVIINITSKSGELLDRIVVKDHKTPMAFIPAVQLSKKVVDTLSLKFETEEA